MHSAMKMMMTLLPLHHEVPSVFHVRSPQTRFGIKINLCCGERPGRNQRSVEVEFYISSDQLMMYEVVQSCGIDPNKCGRMHNLIVVNEWSVNCDSRLIRSESLDQIPPLSETTCSRCAPSSRESASPVVPSYPQCLKCNVKILLESTSLNFSLEWEAPINPSVICAHGGVDYECACCVLACIRVRRGPPCHHRYRGRASSS